MTHPLTLPRRRSSPGRSDDLPHGASGRPLARRHRHRRRGHRQSGRCRAPDRRRGGGCGRRHRHRRAGQHPPSPLPMDDPGSGGGLRPVQLAGGAVSGVGATVGGRRGRCGAGRVGRAGRHRMHLGVRPPLPGAPRRRRRVRRHRRGRRRGGHPPPSQPGVDGPGRVSGRASSRPCGGRPRLHHGLHRADHRPTPRRRHGPCGGGAMQPVLSQL